MMSPENRLTVHQPYDGAEIETLDYAGWPEVDAMLDRANSAFADRARRLPAYRRVEILRRLAALLGEQRDAFALLIAREGGKPLRDARIEADRAVNGVELAAEQIGHLHGREIPMDLSAAGGARLAFTRMEPIGPVVAVSAFNHPLNLIVHQVVPAVATGCPVIVKPANTTPLVCLKFVSLLHEAGLPKDMCQVSVCDIPTAERLVTDGRVAFFTFIGSAKVGWYLRSKLAPGTRCALEHGGAAPVIICDDADLELAIPSLVKGGYYHAGQVCVSVQRIFVDQKIKHAFMEAFANQVRDLTTGDPTKPETDVGPLIEPREVDRVETWVDEAVSSGAEVLEGGKRIDDRLFAPTILADPPASANVSTLEIFGPVTCIYGFDDVDEAVSRANGLPLSFQSAVYTKDIDRALDLSNRLDASAVMINDHTAFRVDWMPFAGRHTSGYGVGGIPHTMEDLVQEKMTVIQLPST
jgi:acyl-CoA reductase-like NAD-dependent aldehyde dehydrogenase